MLRLLNNKVVVFVLTRYFSYVIQFVNSLVVAYVLGPYYLGIWGFILLVLQYLNFGNCGIDIALNVSLSTGDFSDSKKQATLASNAIVATSFTSAFFLCVGALLFVTGAEPFPKYEFAPFVIPVVLISCFNYFNVIFLNICRTYSLFAPISIFQTILQLLQLPVMFILKDESLLWGLLVVMVTAHLVSFFIFLRALPFKLTFKYDSEIIKGLFKRGISLLSYAITFYILLLSTRSMVGYFYSVETMGLFTFATNIASALIVGLSSLEFVLFPKMINRLSVETLNEKLLNTFRDIRFIYTATAFVVVVLGLIFYPLLLNFFNAYKHTTPVFAYLALCQVILSSGFGYSTLIISRQKEFYLVYHGLVALALNLFFSITARLLFHIPYEIMAMFLIFAFIYYDYRVIKKGRELLGLPSSFLLIVRELIPAGSLVPILILVGGLLFPYSIMLNVAALLVFLGINLGKFKLVKEYVSMLFNKPAVVNIQS